MTADEIIIKRDRELFRREKESAIQLGSEDLKMKTDLTIVHTFVHPDIEVERSGKHVWR